MLDGERQRQQQWAGGVALIPTLLPAADRLAKSCDHPESNVFVTAWALTRCGRRSNINAAIGVD
jgi:hypothetical protein